MIKKNIDGEEEDKESEITSDDNIENEIEKENLTKEKKYKIYSKSKIKYEKTKISILYSMDSYTMHYLFSSINWP